MSRTVACLPINDFTLKDLNGRTVHLEQFRGRVVLLNFWATWCTACLAEIPDLIALQNKLGKQVAILGVALDGVTDEHGDVPGEEVGKNLSSGSTRWKKFTPRLIVL
jgi:thiol-disulfide isomerase/thioredoxin